MYKLYRADRYHEPVCKGEYDTLEEAEIAKVEMEHYIEDESSAEYWIEDDDVDRCCYEWFEEEYTTQKGEVIHAFGYYGHD